MLNPTYARQEIKARTGEEKGRHMCPRLVQKVVEEKKLLLIRVSLESERDEKKTESYTRETASGGSSYLVGTLLCRNFFSLPSVIFILVSQCS